MAKVEMEVDNTSLNFLENHRVMIWEYVIGHLMTAPWSRVAFIFSIIQK